MRCPAHVLATAIYRYFNSAPQWAGRRLLGGFAQILNNSQHRIEVRLSIAPPLVFVLLKLLD